MRWKGLIKVTAKSGFALLDPFFGPLRGPRILIYHQVGVSLGREMEVSTRAFIRHLDWLNEHGEIVDLESAIARRSEPEADKLFVLTFDDGFEDIYKNAFPVLSERRHPFTLYLTTDPIESGEPLDPKYPSATPLSWDQVNEMIGSGLVTIGAHTHTHPDLRSIEGSQVATELDVSNQLIEARTGVVPYHFTYPWGWWSESADSHVRKRYHSATIGSTISINGTSDLFRIGRFPVQSSDAGRLFERRMVGGLRLDSMIRRWRGAYSAR